MYNNKKASSLPLKFKHFTRKSYALFACLGKEVVIGTLSASTLTYAKAEGVSTKPVKADTTVMHREVTLDEVSITGSRAPMTRSQAARMVSVLERKDIETAPVQSVNDLLKYVASVDVRQRGPIGAQTGAATMSKSPSFSTASTSVTRRPGTMRSTFLLMPPTLNASKFSKAPQAVCLALPPFLEPSTS